MGPHCSQLLNCAFIFSRDIQSFHTSTYQCSLSQSFIEFHHLPSTTNSSSPQIHKEHTLMPSLLPLYLLMYFFQCVKNRTYSGGVNKTKTKSGRNFQCKTLFLQNWLKMVMSALAVSTRQWENIDWVNSCRWNLMSILYAFCWRFTSD